MKQYTLRFRAKDKFNFLDLKRGAKNIETRAGTPKYRQVTAGDKLIIVCGKDKVTKTVKKTHHFRSLGALLKHFPLKRINPDLNTIAEARKRWYSYPGYKERIKQYGIVAWELK